MTAAGELVERIASADGERVRIRDGSGRDFECELDGLEYHEEDGEFLVDLVEIDGEDVPLAEPPRITSSTDHSGEWEWPHVSYYEEYGEVSERVSVEEFERV